MKFVINRFEGNNAIVETENKQMVNLPRILVPEAKEGDSITIDVDNSTVKRGFEDVTKLMNDIGKQ